MLELLREQFERHSLAGPLVQGAIHRPHASHSQHVLQYVLLDPQPAKAAQQHLLCLIAREQLQLDEVPGQRRLDFLIRRRERRQRFLQAILGNEFAPLNNIHKLRGDDGHCNGQIRCKR